MRRRRSFVGGGAHAAVLLDEVNAWTAGQNAASGAGSRHDGSRVTDDADVPNVKTYLKGRLERRCRPLLMCTSINRAGFEKS